MKFSWVVAFLIAMTTITQAQTQTQTTPPTQGKATAPVKAQAPVQRRSFGDLARAERTRHATTTPAKTIDVQIVTVDKPEEKEATTIAEKPKQERTPDRPQPRALTVEEVEFTQLAQEKTDLLLQLSNVIRDRKAVDEIQQRLSEIQKRTDELKQPASKPSPRLK
jgi:hypothetical protein